MYKKCMLGVGWAGRVGWGKWWEGEYMRCALGVGWCGGVGVKNVYFRWWLGWGVMLPVLFDLREHIQNLNVFFFLIEYSPFIRL